MMPDLSPLLWPFLGAAAACLFTGFFISWGWALALAAVFGGLLVVLILIILSATRFT